jgi:hypothetical protein
MDSRFSENTNRVNRTICLPISQIDYFNKVEHVENFRSLIDEMFQIFPELFPSEISGGYRMKDRYRSKKLIILIRRIEVNGIAYTIRPSFIMPYLTGYTQEAEKPMFLRKFGVPFWALSYCHGRDPMYWYRIEVAIGRNSLVGTTIKDPEQIPKHISADEKHTWIKGEKAYIPCTVGNECILGVAVTESATQADLEKGYGTFKVEARNLKADYQPETVNTDGWLATIGAFTSLFPGIAVIACFLHLYIGIRDRSQKKFKELFSIVSEKLWNCYEAENRASFSQRVRRLQEWAATAAIPSAIRSKIEKLRNNLSKFAAAYDHPGAHRTSNMVDRLMQRLDRYLFSTQYFHGTMTAAEQGIRGWALIQNFAPSNPGTIKKHSGLQSPAERLNGSRYHENWLQNLLASASMGGFRGPPLNPL